MKKLISIFSVIILLSVISCRLQDENLETWEPVNDATQQSAQRKTTDSTTIKSSAVLNEGDPPPKNGTQWRTKK